MFQTRFMAVGHPRQLATNKPRNKEKECLLTDLRLQQVVRTLMVEKLPHYQLTVLQQVFG